MDQVFLFLASKDLRTVFPGNNAAGFTVQLLKILDLKGTWVCGLTEIYITKNFLVTPEKLIVSMDLIEESFISDTQWAVLRQIPVKQNENIDIIFNDPDYFRVVQNRVHRVHLYLRDDDLQPVHFSSGELSCVLHLKRIA